jgi:predicted dehydrogenase
MSPRRNQLVILLGARGAIGHPHAEIYRSLGVPLIELDGAQGQPADVWAEAIVDVCTPTAVHTEAIRWAYALGARRFLVEQPAARNYVDWRTCLHEVPDAQVFVSHSYMFSRTFEVMLDACPTIVSMRATFDDDRTTDASQLRKADIDRRLADVMEIEVPEALAMALAVQPALELSSARYTHSRERGPGSIDATRCEARFTHRKLPEVVVTSDLRASRRRVVELRGDDGRRVVAHFPLSPTAPESVVYSVDARGRRTTLFEGRDNLLRATLLAGLLAMRTNSVPWLASAQFAAIVLARLGEACRVAQAHGGRGDAVGADPGPAAA